MTMNTPFFMFVDDLYIVRKYRRSFVWNYFYHMAMAVLAVTNVIFFIYNWNDIMVVVDQTTLLLTFLGFLFAFAGINIYSIFNTNVEAEKERLTELARQYEEALKMSDSFMLNIKKLGVMQQIGLLITTTPKMTNQHFSWIKKCNNLYKSQEEFIRKVYNAGARDKASEYLADFDDVCQGISASLVPYIEMIKSDANKYFHADFGKDDRQGFIQEVTEMKANLDKITSFSFAIKESTRDIDKAKIITMREKLKIIWDDICYLFKK